MDPKPVWVNGREVDVLPWARAFDRPFGTTDFPILLPLREIEERRRRRFLDPGPVAAGG